MGREIRRVPKDWNHPKNERGKYIPLLGRAFSERLERWDEGEKMWKKGLRDNCKDGWIPIEAEYIGQSFSDWDGDRPVKKDYMPEWNESQKTHIQMYEDCTEGTPISPVMATPEELARWLADNNASAFGDQTATYEQWVRVCNGGYAPSAVMDEKGFRSGVAL